MIRPRFLFFDLGNVLLRFDHARVCRQLAEVAGNQPLGDVTSFVNQYYIPLERGEVSFAAVCQEFRQTFAVELDDAALRDAASDIFWVNEEILPLITRLAMAGMPMGILSNASEPHWHFLQERDFSLLHLFRPRLASFALKALKPDPEIYALAAARVGVPPEEIFFTDDREENVVGARNAGWQAEHYTSAWALESALRERDLAFV